MVQEEVEAIVRRHFEVYEVRSEQGGMAFYVDLLGDHEASFEELRAELSKMDLLPALVRESGENVILILPSPSPSRPRIGLTIGLFLATWITTTLAGAWSVFSYRNADLCIPCLGDSATALAFGGEYLLGGLLQFSLPLMLILTVHEMGHYVTSKWHGLRTSLPFFIPVPPLFAFNIGTMGAFITMRDPIPSRKALFDIGASGPLAGMIVALPVAIIGLLLMAADPVSVTHGEDTVSLGTPLLFQLLQMPFDIPGDAFMHPVALAAWVGFLVTGLNLLPIGQLDGGHVATAMFGKASRTIAMVAMGALLLLGLGIPPFASDQIIPGYTGWLVFALLLSFLGTEHPPTLNSLTPLKGWRVWLGWFTLLVGVVSFVPVPISF